ncbi:MFS transporter [Aquipuribacter sp. MA13-6]|uniref:MFS transporter n=1 Tax=Aquipuribacter sp. MA13-6 TaxID=3440839 RepID=UPI003EEDCEDE
MRTTDERTGSAASTPDDGPGWSPTRAAVGLGVLWGLAAMGTSATSVVLGPLSQDLGLSTAGSAWVLTSFALALAASTAVWGRVADSVGTRTPFLVGGVMLAVGAGLSSLAPSFELLVLGRLLQGLGAGAIPVLSTTTLSARYVGAERSVALGRSNSVVLVLTSLGPLLGGTIGVLVGWRGSVLLPVLALALLPVAYKLAPSRGTGARVDALGAGLVASAAAAVLVTVQTIGQPGPLTVVAAVLAVPLLVLVVLRVRRHPHGFAPLAVVREDVVVRAGVAAVLAVPLLVLVVLRVRRHPHGFVPLAVVREDVVVRAGVAAAAMPVVYFAGLVAVPLVLAGQGWDPMQNGLLLLPGALLGAAVSFNGARVVLRLGRRGTAVLGLALSTLGALVAATVGFSPWLAGLGFVGLSTGYALAQPSLVGSVAAAVPGEVRGAALGLFTLVFFTGSGLGSAVVGGLGDLLTLPGALALAALAPAVAVVVLLTARPSAAWGGRTGDA